MQTSWCWSLTPHISFLQKKIISEETIQKTESLEKDTDEWHESYFSAKRKRLGPSYMNSQG